MQQPGVAHREACLPKLSAYYTELGQNRALFEAYQALASGPAAAGFEVAQKTILEHSLRDFRCPVSTCRRSSSSASAPSR